MSLYEFLEHFLKRSQIGCHASFAFPLPPVFNVLAMHSFGSLLWPWGWEPHANDGRIQRHKLSGSPVVSWATLPSLEGQPLELLLSKKKNTPLLCVCHCLQSGLFFTAAKSHPDRSKGDPSKTVHSTCLPDGLVFLPLSSSLFFYSL